MPLLSRTITVRMEKPVYGGSCIGYAEGKAVLVPFTAPGETVEASIVEEKKDYCIGSVSAILRDSPGRMRPACPHYETCGGCSYLHLGYASELEMKKSIFLDSLSRIAGISPCDAPMIEIQSADRFHYRSQADIKEADGKQGFFQRSSNDLVSIDDSGCLLLAKEINAWIGKNKGGGEGYRIALDASGTVITSLDHDPVVVEREGGLSFHRGIRQFFQVNRFLRGVMLDIVRGHADAVHGASILDIGCGVGFFILGLASGGAGGVGVDISRESIRWAKRNARNNGIGSVEFIAAPSSSIHPARFTPDIAVIDPPRAGIDKKTRKTLAAMSPRTVIYVSCNPATFSRDARDLIKGGYRLETLSLIDMFPGTHHIEVISRFTR